MNRNKAQVLNGRLLAQQIHDDLRDEVERRVISGYRPPHLTAVLVGDDPVSSIYIKMKAKAALHIGQSMLVKQIVWFINLFLAVCCSFHSEGTIFVQFVCQK